MTYDLYPDSDEKRVNTSQHLHVI